MKKFKIKDIIKTSKVKSVKTRLGWSFRRLVRRILKYLFFHLKQLKKVNKYRNDRFQDSVDNKKCNNCYKKFYSF